MTNSVQLQKRPGSTPLVPRLWAETITGLSYASGAGFAFDDVLNAFIGYVTQVHGEIFTIQYTAVVGQDQLIHTALVTYEAVRRVDYQEVLEALEAEIEDLEAAVGFIREDSSEVYAAEFEAEDIEEDDDVSNLS